MAGFVDELLKGATVEVTVAGMPPVTVSLDSNKPSALVQALRPRIVIRKQGIELGRVEPYGNPDVGTPWVPVMLAGGVMLFGLLFFLAAR